MPFFCLTQRPRHEPAEVAEFFFLIKKRNRLGPLHALVRYGNT